ncbi:hypothetical protein MUY21_02910 [Aliiroseovarius sp. S2029]|uniref:hypothetical protein n=1 Tax=Aliiroseovarius sp. S2029 TaxID=2936988 RepID=UPI0020BD6CA5|nr:hypothetical protein [Aliiroseovarius sp. S2029]MCK8482975.1 hypothetical protein [Aliiroseovarius sp. S2029]
MIGTRRRTVNALVASRFAELEAQGHGPHRHEGAVTRQMLEDRVLRGLNPMTGNRTDGVTGGIHPLSRRATRITSEADFVAADAFIRRSSEYRSSRDAVFSLFGRGRPRFEVVLPIEDVLGPDYTSAVEGLKRLGSFNNPQGIVPIDFNGGQVKAVYELTPDGEPVLVTLFPIGKT